MRIEFPDFLCVFSACLCACACLFVNKRKSLQLVVSVICFVYSKKKKIRRDATKPTKIVIEAFHFFFTSCVNLVLLFLLWLFKCSTLLNEKRYSGSRTAFINSFININKPLSVKCRAVAAACIIFFINSATTQNMVHIKCVSETTTTNYTWLRQKRNWNWVETIRQLSHAN